MKKQALILSMLVAFSSAAPVVAMDNQPNNSSRSARFERMFSNLLKLDVLKHAFRRFGQAVDAASEFKENIDVMVGDQKESTNSYKQDAQNAFNNMAQGLNNSFADAEIPGTEKIANDRNNKLMKWLLGVICAYAGFSLLLGFNLFGNSANNQA